MIDEKRIESWRQMLPPDPSSHFYKEYWWLQAIKELLEEREEIRFIISTHNPHKYIPENPPRCGVCGASKMQLRHTNLTEEDFKGENHEK